jgi:polyhydroxyalkanoate synthesis regulator phasin
MLSGIELANLTKGKIENLSKDLVKKGSLTKEEGKKLISVLAKRSKEAQKGFNRQVEKTVKGTMKKMNIASKDEVQALQKEITALKKGKKKKTVKKKAVKKTKKR